MWKKYTALLLFLCIYAHYAQSAAPQAPIAPPAIFNTFNPFIMLPIGLHNFDNSCYMNAMLQCLYRISPITKTLVDTANLNTTDELLLAYQKFVNTYTYSLQAAKNIIPTNLYLKLINALNFNRGQQDSQEALNGILNILPQELSNNYKLTTVSTITCTNNHKSTKLNDPENMLILPITPDNSDLNNYLTNYFAIEQIDYKCSICTQPKATKKTMLSQLPNYLIIKINLEKYAQNIATKQLAHPEIPLDNLDISDYLQEGVADNDNYELFGCVWHIGISLRRGHYVATVKVDKQWYLCNDSTISTIDSLESNIATGYLSLNNRTNPYILFYKKQGLDSKEEIYHAKYPENEEPQTQQDYNYTPNQDSSNSAILAGAVAVVGTYIFQALSDWWSSKPAIVNIKSDLSKILSDSGYSTSDQYLFIAVDEQHKNAKKLYSELEEKSELIGYVEQYKTLFLRSEKSIAHVKTQNNGWIKVDLEDIGSYVDDLNTTLPFDNIKLFCFKLNSESSDLVNLTTTLGVLS